LKYIVIQSFVGRGTWLHLDKEDELTHLYDDILLPSFARYCEKHGYKHVVYKEQLDLIERANQKYGDHHGNLYHQYLSALNHKDEDVDFFVFPDADFYVTQKAKPFPETQYISGAPWKEEDLIQRGKDPKTFKAIYGGIQIMTKKAAIELATYLEDRFTNYIEHDKHIQMHPNMLTVGDWLTQNNIETENLSFYYNCILDDIRDRPWTDEDDQTGFWHLYGKNKLEKLDYIFYHMDGM
jgi:hypothetical protein